MSGFAFRVGLGADPLNPDEAAAMAAAAAYRGRAGQHARQLGPAAAVFLDGGEEPGLLNTSPALSPDGNVLLVADARIDNAADLAAQLGRSGPGAASDTSVLLIDAYQRWGDTFAQHLLGDFVVVLWDARRQQLVAVRDESGLRPVVYRYERGQRLLLASDVAQILAAGGVDSAPDERQIAAFLVGLAGSPDATFYRGVARLPPGHTLVVDNQGPRVRRHVLVSGPARVRHASSETCIEELRTHLDEAVGARLSVVKTAGLMLSGGLDSIAIAAAAGRLRRRGAATAGLLTYSFAFDDTPECDERDVSHLVAEGCGLINHPVPTANGWPLSADVRYGPVMDGPYRFRSHPLLDRSMALARADGATTLMLGQRGDALVGEDVVDYAGLLAAGRVRQAWTELAAHGRLTGASRPGLVVRYLLRQIAAVVWPPHVAPLARGRLRGAADGSYVNFPRWLRPDAVARFGLRELAAAGIPRSPLRGEARRTRHRHILDAHNERNAEALELRLARDGLRYVDPWSDRRLAEFVLGLPQYAITPAGQAKGLLRDALRGIIPEPARVQARKRSPQAFYVRGLLGPSRPAVLGLMTGSRAAARGFVDETKIREIYLGLSAPGGRMAGREWGFLWRFLETENWLRQFHDR